MKHRNNAGNAAQHSWEMLQAQHGYPCCKRSITKHRNWVVFRTGYVASAAFPVMLSCKRFTIHRNRNNETRAVLLWVSETPKQRMYRNNETFRIVRRLGLGFLTRSILYISRICKSPLFGFDLVISPVWQGGRNTAKHKWNLCYSVQTRLQHKISRSTVQGLYSASVGYLSVSLLLLVVLLCLLLFFC